MEKAWPPLKECYQYKIGLMDHALWRYPWEDDEYAFDFNSYYPPIPEELASLRKLLDHLHKNEFRPAFPEDIRNCPFCRLHPDPPGVDIPTGPGCYYDMIPLGVDILKDPVWDMDPIPCPFHLLEHVWPRGSRPCLVTPTQLEDTKKYLNQVRNSRGYDVDCVPDALLVISEFWNFDLNDEVGRRFKDRMIRKLDATAIVLINKKTDKVYQLEDILKIVWTRNFLFLITFTAKVENDDDCDTFIAIIDQHRPLNEALRECLLKPGCDAPGPDHYPDFIIHPIQVPDFSMERPGCSYFCANSSNSTSSAAAPLGSRKRPGEHYPTLSKPPHTMTSTTPPLEDSQSPVFDLIPKAPEEHSMRCFFGKPAEEMLTYFSDEAKLKEVVEKWKSQADIDSYFKSQAGVTPKKDLSPLDPSIFPLQPVEAEPLQTLPPAVEEYRDLGGGSSVHVEETSPNPEAEDIPSPLI